MFGQTLTSCKCITKRVNGRKKVGPCFNSFLFGFQPDRVPCLPPALHGRSDTLTLLTTAHVFEKLGPLLVNVETCTLRRHLPCGSICFQWQAQFSVKLSTSLSLTCCKYEVINLVAKLTFSCRGVFVFSLDDWQHHIMHSDAQFQLLWLYQNLICELRIKTWIIMKAVFTVMNTF